MNKNAQITTESPCEKCGRESETVIKGIPYCRYCCSTKRSQEPTRPTAIDKVATDIQNHF